MNRFFFLYTDINVYYTYICVCMHAVWVYVYKQSTCTLSRRVERRRARAGHHGGGGSSSYSWWWWWGGIDSSGSDVTANFHPIYPSSYLKLASLAQLMTNAQGKGTRKCSTETAYTPVDDSGSIHFTPSFKRFFASYSFSLLCILIAPVIELQEIGGRI